MVEVIFINAEDRSFEIKKLPASVKYDNKWEELVDVDSDGYLTAEFEFSYGSECYAVWMRH